MNECIISGYVNRDKPIINEPLTIRVPKVIARIKICGGGLTFTITDDMQFEMPTIEQCENLKKTFGIEVELIDEEVKDSLPTSYWI